MIPLNNKLRLYSTAQIIFNSLVSSRILGTLSPDEGDGNKNVKVIRTQLCTRNTLFGPFLDRQGRNTTCQISRFMEDVNKQRRSFLLNLDKTRRRCRRVGVIAMKVEKTRIHFLSDVFAAVAAYAF